MALPTARRGALYASRSAVEQIGDHAIIGDGRSAALVSKSGVIDWLCWPRFDCPSWFGAILDDDAGHFRVAPVGPARVERAYVYGTNVLVTRFVTSQGTLALTDLMPVACEAEKRREMLPDHELLRVAHCEAGEVELELELVPRPHYGARRVTPRFAGRLGARF